MGQPAMARPSAGVASHLQGGERLWPRPPAKGRPTATSLQGQQPPAGKAICNEHPQEWPAYKGQSPAASPQGATANKGNNAGSRSDRPLVGQLPTGKGSSRLRRRDGAVRVREEGSDILLRKGQSCPSEFKKF
ncbi:hypothetical protein BHM03_00060051 [Ensete ventricosum]|nr:hypothetical protein BHM03_00060051 [Ensete ventricosum]